MFSTLLSLCLLTTSPDTLHQQWVAHESSFVLSYPGTLVLTNEGVNFQPENEKKQHLHFSLAYEDISQVKRAWWYLFPNRTLIRTQDGKRYTLYTYRRKKIIRIIAAHINRKK